MRTFSQASVVGSLRSDSQVTNSPARGPDHARANRSVQPADVKAPRTLAISGPLGSGSFASAALTEFLASKLRARSRMVGSTIYPQTWKARTTPSGRLYSEHIVLVHRMSDSDFTGWVTPCARDFIDTGQRVFADPLSYTHTTLGRQVHLSHAATGNFAPLNPAFPCWLMGFQIAWLNCAVSATRSSRK